MILPVSIRTEALTYGDYPPGRRDAANPERRANVADGECGRNIDETVPNEENESQDRISVSDIRFKVVAQTGDIGLSLDISMRFVVNVVMKIVCSRCPNLLDQ